MNIESSYNFREIDSQITTSGVVGEEILKSLSKEGYQIVINLLPNDSEYAVPGEKEILESQNIKYIHMPVGFGAPKYDEYLQFSYELDKLSGEKVHIHCAANWRVSAFYSAYAVSKGIWSREKAIAFISSIWSPAEYPVWENFVKRLGLEAHDR